MSDTGFLSGGAARVWCVPAGAPFLSALAGALADAVNLRESPEALADGVVYLPNRRSARAFAEALHAAAGGRQTLLMPEIRALGDLETDDAPPGLDAAFADLGPALSDAKRLGTLMAMVKAWFDAQERSLPAASALAAAQNLAALLDEAAIAGKTDWSDLGALVERTDLAAHWQESIRFLEIITEHYPAWLAEQGVEDKLARRLAAARAIAAHWNAVPPKGPVIIAGSTGATPASRILMAAASRAPQGAVVLPGLDRSLTGKAIEEIATTPSHPQFALLETLSEFHLSPGDVPVLPGLDEDGLAARRALIHESLSPAELTGDWRKRLEDISAPLTPDAFTRTGLSGLDLIAAHDETEEAMLAACLLRETLETPGRTAALVCPDAGLARRVSAHLKRWDLEVTPSEGTPLAHLPAGIWFDALLDWWIEPADPVRIAALLHAPGTTAPDGAALFERWVLRGVRWWESLEDMQARLKERLTEGVHHKPADDELAQIKLVAAWLVDTAAVLNVDETLSAEGFRTVVRTILPRLCDPQELWRGGDGAALAGQVESLMQLAEAYGPLLLEDWLGLWRQMAADANVPPSSPGHPRLQIHGQLEARLQTADHVILAGLNEGVWPNSPGADAFLPRHFKTGLGLEDSEARMGLAAHDFASLACAPRVTLLCSKRREDAPAVASRWIWRLQTLARGALGGEVEDALGPAPERDPRVWAGLLKRPVDSAPLAGVEPRPRPPADKRPESLSVTRIDVLQRDPYAIYAERVLKLSKLEDLDQDMDARQRGTAIHKALELFEKSPAIGAEGLAASLADELRKAGAKPEVLLGERVALAETARRYVDWHAGRAVDPDNVRIEIGGDIKIPRAGELKDFKLTATADRVEIREGGAIAIIDFKTGNPPSDKEIGAGLSQQMPLQALIAREGGFSGVPAADVTELTYVTVRADFRVHVIGLKKPLEKSAMELADDALAGLTRLIRGYDNPEQAYLSAPRAQFVKYEGDYGRLARRAEWTSEISDG